MKTYEFELIFKLADQTQNAETYMDALFENGCDDATVSTGKLGMIALAFSREADNASEAIESAIANVSAAIPDVELVEATPDMVSITEISSIFGHTRQNTRKLFEKSMPTPMHVGNPSIWHLSDVLEWAKSEIQKLEISDTLYEVSYNTKKVNIQKQVSC